MSVRKDTLHFFFFNHPSVSSQRSRASSSVPVTMLRGRRPRPHSAHSVSSFQLPLPLHETVEFVSPQKHGTRGYFFTLWCTDLSFGLTSQGRRIVDRLCHYSVFISFALLANSTRGKTLFTHTQSHTHTYTHI